jgi:predicted phosphodiesterase
MRIQIASDLHLDALQSRFPRSALLEAAAGADVLVLAGDIHLGTGAVEIFADWPVAVIYVNGNHEA